MEIVKKKSSKIHTKIVRTNAGQKKEDKLEKLSET